VVKARALAPLFPLASTAGCQAILGIELLEQTPVDAGDEQPGVCVDVDGDGFGEGCVST